MDESGELSGNLFDGQAICRQPSPGRLLDNSGPLFYKNRDGKGEIPMDPRFGEEQA